MEASRNLCILSSASEVLAVPLRALGTAVDMQLRTESCVGDCYTPGKCALKDREVSRDATGWWCRSR